MGKTFRLVERTFIVMSPRKLSGRRKGALFAMAAKEYPWSRRITTFRSFRKFRLLGWLIS